MKIRKPADANPIWPLKNKLYTNYITELHRAGTELPRDLYNKPKD